MTGQFDLPLAENNATIETPQNRRLYSKAYSSSPLAQLYN